ncbi:MAG: DegT/DnrJ/EryC1/StrS family aminotransferase [Proteobacteria bacterium]|nr:DegT/DnrJ/EryC1/StrS family aminotransferase [Pseudomonadota bacterium]
MIYKIPLYQPSLTGNEKKYVNECLDSTWISSKGKFIPLFEQKFAEYIGVRHAASVCNGTVALHLALMALGMGPGDEVIVPTLTYVASVNAIAYTGATPVFVDSLPDTWQMDPNDVEVKLSERTKAIMVVPIYGHPCDMDAIMEIARINSLYVIEDCAEAIGSKYKGQLVGTFGDIGTFSFFGNKTITTGEGGMVVTNNEELYNKVFHLKGQGLSEGREYWHDIIGYNYRMTNICAAIGLAQMEQVQTFLMKKRQIANWYAEELINCPKIEFHREIGDLYHSYWMCSILVDELRKRDVLRRRLAEKGIETRPFFWPVNLMPMYYKENMHSPVAEDLASRGVNLPSYPLLTKEQVHFVSHEIIRVMGEGW